MFGRWNWIRVAALFATALGLSWGCSNAVLAEKAVVIDAPALDNPRVAGPVQTAVLAGGCFWGIQAVFEHVTGVRKVISGYSGGTKESAEYEIVSTGNTGHAESVQISFDPKEVSYGQILQIYFSVAHDPTQLNRQDPDIGTQYRSNIFFSDEMQKKIAESYIAQLNKSKVFGRTIMTRVDALKGFYPAEEYHQDFLVRNPLNPYIQRYDLPKLDRLKATFPALYRAQAISAR